MDLPQEFQATIRALFASLKQDGIPAAIVRGGEELPSRFSGNDLDIYVSSANRRRAGALLCKAAESSGLVLLHCHSRSYFSAFWFGYASNSNTAFLHIDLYPGAFTWRGISYLSDKEILSDALERNGFPVVAPPVKACALLLTSLLWGGFFKKKYLGRLQKLLADEKVFQDVSTLLNERFSADETLLKKVQTGSLAELNVTACVRELRCGVVSRRFQKRPFRTLREIFAFGIGELGAWLNPPGLHIAVLGPDGAGKSLLIENVLQQISPLFGAVDTFHWRPGVLPDIGVLLKRRTEERPTIVPDPHAKPPHGMISSILRLFYYLCDYWLGFFLKVWPAKARNHLVIFDRYAWDMAVDPRRYRFKLPNTLLSILCSFVPRPDLTLVLVAPAEILLSRKQEIPKDELDRILVRLKNIGSAHENFSILDSDQMPRKVCEDATILIQRKLLARIPMSNQPT